MNIRIGGIAKLELWYWGLLFLMIGICIPLGLHIAPADVPRVDEEAHFGQIQIFWSGRLETPAELGITMLPGYHAAVALLTKLAGVTSLSGARATALLITIPSIFIFALLARRAGDNNPPQSALVYFLCPLFFPYFFLLYTDISSITFVMLGVLLTLYNRYYSAAFTLLLSMLIRQDNVIWAFFCFLLGLHQIYTDTMVTSEIKSRLTTVLRNVVKNLWAFPALFVAFITFVVINGGVAIGDPESHKLGQIYPTQVFLCLLTLFVLMLPLHLANTKRIAALLYERPIWLFAGACGLPLFILTFWADHGYNNFSGFVHNEVVSWLRASLRNKILAYLGIIWCFYSLIVTKLAEQRFYWLYPLSLVAVLPHALIEHRYFMIPIVLFLALRSRNGDKLDFVTMSIFVIASWYLGMEIKDGRLFL